MCQVTPEVRSWGIRSLSLNIHCRNDILETPRQTVHCIYTAIYIVTYLRFFRDWGLFSRVDIQNNQTIVAFSDLFDRWSRPHAITVSEQI